VGDFFRIFVADLKVETIMKKAIIAITALMALLSCGGQKEKEVTNKNKGDMTQITYHKVQVEDCKVFYREAGNPEKPAILLLHGFPSSSHMFRDLMPELADEYHLIAPDFPSFGQTESPSREEFEYSFDHLAKIVDKFTELIGLTKFAMYVFDYGAPIGYRLAMWHPERITAIVSQNGVQAGDPDKAGDLYIKVAEMDKPYESLPMGTDSCTGIRDICARTVTLMDELLPVAKSTDF